ncbi:MAG: AbfB domain-containing protein [Pseudomonadota bacterium]
MFFSRNKIGKSLCAVLGAALMFVNSSAFAQSWNNYGGNWTHSGAFNSVDSGLGSKSILAGSNFQSSTMEADVSVGAGGDAGFVFRASNLGIGADAYSGYYVGLSTLNNTVVLGRANNNWTEMIAYPFQINANTNYHLKLVSSGKSIEVFVNNIHVLSAGDDVYMSGAAGLRVMGTSAQFSNVAITNNGTIPVPTYNFSSVKGAVYVPTNTVNYLEWWQNYDPTIVDRELSYAQTYGFNTIAVYLHYLHWENNAADLLNKFENFLQIANDHGMKVTPIFFDDCWDPNPHLGDQGAPIPGRHNSRWVQSPGQNVKDNYTNNYKPKVRNYVQAVVNAHKFDGRILLWEQMNEPGCNSGGAQKAMNVILMNDARIAIKDTGTTIPVGSPSVQQWEPWYFSDFFSFHPYGSDYAGPYGPTVLNSETMNRGSQTVPGIVANYGDRNTGYILWEFGIGRSNTRFPWGSPDGAPEPATPFHGVVYPDGHPWSVADVVALNGPTANMAVFNVEYFNGNFATSKKVSITPMIDFDLNTERGTASPDASAGVSEINYSIRWNGTIRPSANNTYTFYADSDNVARVWVNNVLVVNKTNAGRGTVQGNIGLNANQNYPVKVEYVHATGPSNMHVTWSSPNMGRQPLTVIPAAFLSGNNRFSASNVANSFIRHANSRARVDANVNPLADSQWRVVPGLADPLAVSFESINFPGQFLRHRNGEIWKDASDGSTLFAGDATWKVRAGLNNPNQVSFESFNFAGNFIRHRDFLLYSEAITPASSAIDKGDATFNIN